MSLEEPLSVSDAARLLGVEPRTVRLMASAGEIEAMKRGNAWWLDRRSVERRSRQERGRGRPLSAPMAWAVLLLASGHSARCPQLAPHYPSRARRWLGQHSLADDAARLRSRGRRESFAAHPSEFSRIAARSDVMRTGISAANSVGIHGGSGEVELYAPAGRREAVVTEHALEPGEGPVLLRWVPDDLWPIIDSDVAPAAAVLVDLLEHDDPRARREAAAALRRA